MAWAISEIPRGENLRGLFPLSLLLGAHHPQEAGGGYEHGL